MFRELKIFSALLCVSCSALMTGHAQKNGPELEVVSILSDEINAAVPVLTLDAMYQLIKDTSPQVLFEKATVRRALEYSFQERAVLLPQISLVASQTRQQFGRGFAGDDFESPPFNSFGARVEAAQTVFDVKKYSRYRIAKLEHAISKMDYEVAVQDILEQAVQLYITQIRDLNRKRIVEGNVGRSQRLLKLAQDQLSAGAGNKIDVTRAKARALEDGRDLLLAETNTETSMLRLKALLDLDLDSTLTLDGSMMNALKAPPAMQDYKIKGTFLIGSRPELTGQKKRLEQALLARKAASWQRLPSVELFGDWGYDSDEAFSSDYNEAWLVGVRVSVPVFDGFRIESEKREAAAVARQASYQMRVLDKRIESEFRTALFDMTSRYKQMGLAQKEIDLGFDEVEQAELRYREGLADNRELIDAQQRLADAERSHLNSVYLYSVSRLAYARAIGSVETVLD